VGVLRGHGTRSGDPEPETSAQGSARRRGPRRSGGLVAVAVLVALLAVSLVVTRGDSDEKEALPTGEGTPTLDLRTGVGRDATFLAAFDPVAFARGAGIDQIRAIDDPVFEAPAEAAKLLRDTDLVIAVELDGDARAYPEKLLSLHEVVNDVVGGSPVAIVWCPLCRTATAFQRTVDGDEHVFGVSGLLYHRNVILFDRETGSLWSQLLGGAVTGSLRGTEVTAVPVTQETFGRWREKHPEGQVLSIARDAEADLFTDPFENGTTSGPESSDAPYTAYWSKVATFYRGTSKGLADSALVVGVVAGGTSKAYSLRDVARRRVVEDEVGGVPILLAVGDRGALWASVFSRDVDGRVLDFAFDGEQLVDAQTGTEWSFDGLALEGELAGTQLHLLPATTSYWFAWRSLYPDADVWR
jgi:hypothetical protein